ncbi:N-acetylmuramoyl-L-alanine amidase [Paenibacillus sp. NEAU-GSW1]|nr:N-acetylmuramoyl-L-alanine amidase [Paenibacillus sp. NEAU-GSW1]
MKPPATAKPVISAEDANKIIKFLSAGYSTTSDAEARAEFNRLANELRKASGQKLQ